jgi:hypothetical protein
MARWFAYSLLLCLIWNLAFAADGFREFRFGDSLDTIKNTGQRLCSFGEVTKHSRWPWRTLIDCKGYRFKKDTPVALYFQFADDKLVKIHVVSRDIPNYYLIRYPEFNYLFPKINQSLSASSSNLADRLLFKDKVHQLADEYRYLTFYHEGKWEWEYIYQHKSYVHDEERRVRNLLEEEAEAGVKGWNKFKFNDSQEAIKDKLVGMCSALAVESGSGVESIKCGDFIFLDTKIEVYFIFETSGLVKIELKLPTDWYDQLSPMLKKKYGLPYLELTNNTLYYPSIEFPEASVVLAYKNGPNAAHGVWLTLKYIKKGYADKDQVSIQKKESKKSDTTPSSKLDRILDSI